MDRYINTVAKARQRLVHGIIHHLPDQVMQTRLACGSDIHRRPLANSLKSPQHLNTCRIVLLALRRFCLNLLTCLFHFFSIFLLPSIMVRSDNLPAKRAWASPHSDSGTHHPLPDEAGQRSAHPLTPFEHFHSLQPPPGNPADTDN